MVNKNTTNINDWYVIVNPKAGLKKNRAHYLELEEALTKHDISFEMVLTEYKYHANELTANAIRTGYKKLMAVGGDGTVHEVINGIMHQDVVNSTDILFNCLPNGTGNDWARHHKLSTDVGDCIKRMQNETIDHQDLGLATYYNNGKLLSRYFNNVAGMAYDAFVVKEMEKQGRKSSSILYLLGVLKYLFQYTKNDVTITTEEGNILSKVYTVNVGICKYSGSGMSLVPHANPADGLLALTVAKDLSKLDVLLNTYRFYNESLLDHKLVEGSQVKTISITNNDQDNPLYLELDGELVGKSPFEFVIVEKAIQFLI